MDSDDVVEPIDAAWQELVAAVAEHTTDHDRRDALIDHVLTAPPITEWPAGSRQKLIETCESVIDRARQLRQDRRRP